MSESELSAEVEHHDRVRSAITSMRESTSDLMASYHRDYMESRRNRRPGDAKPDQNLGFAMAQYRAARLEDLSDTGGPLFFGRLWLDSGEDYHLGRRHVRDGTDRSVPLVVDWRAPLAERFYRATAHRRMEVTRRRRFGFADGTLSSLEDEDLRSGEDVASELLTAEIERPRTGPMRDIVATIQPEQDELIRRGAGTTLCVQGAPGTGKTAVGLHRAAWLLYTYPRKLQQGGMLVVGPNDGFLRYIAAVLPTLGETSVWQVTVGELTGAGEATGTDPDEVAVVKNDARMAQVCERAVWSHLGTLERDAVVPHAGTGWTLDAGYVAEAVSRARIVARGWNAGRKSFEQAALHGFVRQAEERTGLTQDNRWVKEFAKQPVFKAFIDHMWPRLSATKVLRRLYQDEEFRASVCAGVLTAEETALLRRGTGAFKPSPADVLLLDEIQAQLGRPASQKTYGHVVVDEAQDLSPIQCRAIARRCPTGAMTVLGDLAQGTTPWAATDWPTQMAHLDRATAEHTELTTGYRVPAVIVELANRLLPHLGVAVSPARSLRADGSVDVLSADDPVDAAVDAVEKALIEPGLVGVIATDTTLEELRGALPGGERVELVPARLAKGLEFDHVVVVEPADLGLRHLYVALTRAVSRLTVVHTRPVPPELGRLSPR